LQQSLKHKNIGIPRGYYVTTVMCMQTIRSFTEAKRKAWVVTGSISSWHGRRKGGLGTLDFEIFSKKGCLSLEWEKTNSTTFGPPRKTFEKIPLAAPPEKKP